MKFDQLFNAIQFEPPSLLYELEEWGASKPFILSEKAIQQLVDFSVLHKPKVCLKPSNKVVDLLTQLLSMGTETDSKDNPDPYIGQKDQRIESCIIEKAMTKAKQAGAREEVVFGLSGNPPTLNHLIYIQHLLTQYEKVHAIINAQSTLKDAQSYQPADIRLAMLLTMLEAEHVPLDRCILERIEIDRDPPSRMIGTLSLLILNADEQARFVLVLGMDGLIDFQRWYRWRDYKALCHIKIYPREGVICSEDKFIELLGCMLDAGMHVTLVYHSDPQKIVYERIQRHFLHDHLTLTEEHLLTYKGSATELRAYYSQKHAHSGIPENIHPAVDAMIRKRHLYGL